MTKWFEEVANDASNIVSSRVRLSRNWEEYKFPSRLEPDEADDDCPFKTEFPRSG